MIDLTRREALRKNIERTGKPHIYWNRQYKEWLVQNVIAFGNPAAVERHRLAIEFSVYLDRVAPVCPQRRAPA